MSFDSGRGRGGCTHESSVSGVDEKHDHYAHEAWLWTSLKGDIPKFIRYAVWKGIRLASDRLVPVLLNAETTLKSENQVGETSLA